MGKHQKIWSKASHPMTKCPLQVKRLNVRLRSKGHPSPLPSRRQKKVKLSTRFKTCTDQDLLLRNLRSCKACSWRLERSSVQGASCTTLRSYSQHCFLHAIAHP